MYKKGKTFRHQRRQISNTAVKRIENFKERANLFLILCFSTEKRYKNCYPSLIKHSLYYVCTSIRRIAKYQVCVNEALFIFLTVPFNTLFIKKN